MKQSTVMAIGTILLALGAGMQTLAATPAASAPATPGAAPAPSPAAAALYSQILDKYIAAQWDSIAPDLARTKDIATLSKEQQADVAYIKRAVAEGRPAWWDKVKQGQKMTLQTPIWTRTINTTFDPSLPVSQISMQQTGGQISLTLNWGAADMDSTAQAEHGFTKGDLLYVGIWSALETAQLYSSLTADNLARLDQNGKNKLSRFLQFRDTVAAAYYGTPCARRWAAFLSFDAYQGEHLHNDGFIPRRPFAVFLEEEIVAHPDKYPSFRLPRNLQAATVEAALATNLMGQMGRVTPSFAEDKALREATRAFAVANALPVFASGKVVLPSKLNMPLDPAEDGDGATKRGEWLMEEIAHPGIHAEQATRPATRPK